MTAAILVQDLILGSRIQAAAEAAGVPLRRLASLDELPEPSDVTLLFVAWDERAPDWGPRLAAWCASAPQSSRPRLILFGPHSDLASHAEAKRHGIGPVWARSKLVAELAALLADRSEARQAPARKGP